MKTIFPPLAERQTNWPDPKLPEVRVRSTVPDAVLLLLARRSGKYSDMRSVFYCIQLDVDCWIGVAGDGGNASYEWFVVIGNELETSDCGYGDSLCALRDVLVKQVH